MKKSKTITLTLLNGIVLTAAAACGPTHIPIDPCMTRTYNEIACQSAVSQHGYYYDGSFIPLIYPNPFWYYQNNAHIYIARGGVIYSAPYSVYNRTYIPVATRADAMANRATSSGTFLSNSRMSSFSAGRTGSVVSRGGFGSIGSGHSSAGA